MDSQLEESDTAESNAVESDAANSLLRSKCRVLESDACSDSNVAKSMAAMYMSKDDVFGDNDATRGMVRQVRFLVSVEEVAEEAPRGRGRAASDTGKSDAEAAQE